MSPEKQTIKTNKQTNPNELTFSFNSPVEEDDRLLIGGVFYALFNDKAKYEILPGPTPNDMLIKGKSEELKKVDLAISTHMWEESSEMAKKVYEYIEDTVKVEDYFPDEKPKE